MSITQTYNINFVNSYLFKETCSSCLLHTAWKITFGHFNEQIIRSIELKNLPNTEQSPSMQFFTEVGKRAYALGRPKGSPTQWLSVPILGVKFNSYPCH